MNNSQPLITEAALQADPARIFLGMVSLLMGVGLIAGSCERLGSRGHNRKTDAEAIGFMLLGMFLFFGGLMLVRA